MIIIACLPLGFDSLQVIWSPIFSITNLPFKHKLNLKLLTILCILKWVKTIISVYYVTGIKAEKLSVAAEEAPNMKKCVGNEK